MAVFFRMRVWDDRSPARDAKTIVHSTIPQPTASEGTAVYHNLGSIGAPETSPKAKVARDALPGVNSPVLSQAVPPGELYLRMLLARTQARSPSEGEELIYRFLAQRIVEPNGDLEELVRPLLTRRMEFEQRLLNRFRAFAVGGRETAAIELLGCIGSQASVPLLVHLSLKSSMHAPAVQALLKIADARTLARLMLREEDPTLRQEIADALRARNDKQTSSFVLATEGEPSCVESGLGSWLRSESL
jgi:hypothetical protein